MTKKTTRVNLYRTHNLSHEIGITSYKEKQYEAQFPTNLILNVKIGKKINYKKWPKKITRVNSG